MMAPRRTHADWCWRIRGAERGSLAGRLDAIGWGAFFIWIGIALLADFGWGLALLGIGLITLAGQVTRWFYRLELEGALMGDMVILIGTVDPVLGEADK